MTTGDGAADLPVDTKLRIQYGSTVAIVDESGFGKPTMARVIMGLLPLRIEQKRLLTI